MACATQASAKHVAESQLQSTRAKLAEALATGAALLSELDPADHDLQVIACTHQLIAC